MNQYEWEMPSKERSRASQFRARARASLKTHWGIAIFAMLLAGLLGAFSSFGGSIGDIDVKDLKSFETTIREWIDWGKTFGSSGAMLRALWNKAIEWLRSSPVTLFTAGFAVFGSISGLLYSLLLGGPVSVGYRQFGLHLIDGKEAKIRDLFSSFRGFWWKTVAMRFLIGLCRLICSLISVAGMGLVVWFFLRRCYGESASAVLSWIGIAGGILLMVAGVFLELLVSFRLFLCPFLLAEYPQFKPAETLRHSEKLMKGNKWRLFCLYFSFIGWYLLIGVTFGIAAFWVVPYVHTAEVEFYDEISERSRAGKVEFPSLDPNDYQ